MNSPLSIANIRRFIAFRIFFNARFYYPVFTILFLDMGLSLEQFALLNVIWAATIVLLEVPSGAFADTFGRKNLLVLAGVCMVVEMLILCFVPLGNMQIVFYALALNRIISGVAEAMASGADEALAYDSLKAETLDGQWGHVLERLMILQSLAFFCAMLVGAAVYDAAFMTQVCRVLGFDISFAAETTLRFPLYLNLFAAFVVLGVTLRMEEVESADDNRSSKTSLPQAAALTWQTGRWIMSQPVVWCLLLIVLTYDSIIRLFLTLNSEYYRLIHIPEAALGVMGAAMGILGLLMPKIARILSQRYSVRVNFAFVGLLVLMGLCGLALAVPWWGIVPAMMIGSAMFFLNFFMSVYLNKAVDSERRATVLSFRGLVCNLAYGVCGLFYMGLTHALRGHAASEQTVFAATLEWFPAYFLGALLVLAIIVWRRLARMD